MALKINKSLVFIDSKQFVNTSFEKPVKNLSDDNFKHFWTQEFGCKNLQLFKQNDAYPYEFMDSFERFCEKKKKKYLKIKDTFQWWNNNFSIFS